MDERAERQTMTTGEVARRWRVHPDTARAILRRQAVRPAKGGRRPRWWVEDVRGIEGGPRAGDGSAEEVLLTAADCARGDPLGRSARSWRRIIAGGRIPTVRLAPGITRVRPNDFADLAELA